ncbi:MAG: 3-methyl-2-oxobutanoate dehydrogenase subunit VorB [candidate division Zixibacteria bacterium]|nr:3-methyl-2-oxobutanoate dehydrogenase subunit VorB [candidate division Zixibacteria bacterium]
MRQELLKGNEAVVVGAVLAGCRSYYGYPITPASEIAETAALLFPKVGGTFLQAESEVAAINMVYGAASSGQRTMTASSSPGISLKQEGISYCAGAELPCVIVDIMRGGPGLGNIGPEQADYNQMVKGGGHGNYRVIVLAPNGAQEMCGLTMLAFDLADRYRNPVAILADGFIGQMMEPVTIPDPVRELPQRPWAVTATDATRDNLITSIFLDHDELEAHINALYAKYAQVEQHEVRFEEYRLDDCEYVAVAYGIVSRLLMSAIDQARAEGIKVGMLRPITLWPFPAPRLKELAHTAKAILVAECSTGMLIDDVRLAVECRIPVQLCSRTGGNVPGIAELVAAIGRLRESAP